MQFGLGLNSSSKSHKIYHVKYEKCLTRCVGKPRENTSKSEAEETNSIFFGYFPMHEPCVEHFLILKSILITFLIFTSTFTASMLTLLKIPSILVCSLGIIATSASIGFLGALLEPHLRQFNLSPVILGDIHFTAFT